MSTFDANAFSVQSFSAQSFDLEEVAGAIRGSCSGSSSCAGDLEGVQVGGRKPKKNKKRYLVTIRGNRFMVPEDDLAIWLAKQEDELVEEAAKPVSVVKVRGRKTVKAEAKEPPRIVAPSGDAWLKGVIAEANRRVFERVAAHRRMLEDDEEAISILMMAL